MARRTLPYLALAVALAASGPAVATNWDEYIDPGLIGAGTTPWPGIGPQSIPCPPTCRPDPHPEWVFRADVLAAWRSPPQSLLLFQDWNQPSREYGQPALNAQQYASSGASGPRLVLLRDTAGGVGFEASFLRVQSFSADLQRPFVPVGYAIAETTTIYGNTWTALDAIESRLNSAFQSAEFLARQPTWLEWLTLTGGFRWVEWNEQLDITTPYRFGTPPLSLVDSYTTTVGNDLYGFQLGLDASRAAIAGHVLLQGIAKAGVYGNDGRQSSRYVTNDTEFPYDASVATDVLRTAFVGELGANLGWKVTEGISARIGYSVFWLAGLATAAEQLVGQTLVEGEPVTGSTSTGGSVLIQALTLGLEGRW